MKPTRGRKRDKSKHVHKGWAGSAGTSIQWFNFWHSQKSTDTVISVIYSASKKLRGSIAFVTPKKAAYRRKEIFPDSL